MPQPSEPPRVSMTGPGGEIATEWRRWFTEMHSALTSRQFYVPVIAGAPTFTPEDRPGFAAMVYDETNNRIYVYDGGWISAALS